MEDCETGRSARDGAGAAGLADGGVSVVVFWISSVTSRDAFLNSLIHWPRPLANSGIFLEPNNTKMTTRIKTISMPPGIHANKIFINFIEPCQAYARWWQ